MESQLDSYQEIIIVPPEGLLDGLQAEWVQIKNSTNIWFSEFILSIHILFLLISLIFVIATVK